MSDSRTAARRVLLTGAAGEIASAFRRQVGAQYQFRLADRVTDTLRESARSDHEVITLDIADLAACQAACHGMDTVIHLAADRDPRADFYASLLDNNIKGVYNIFRAAKDQGCRRVIFASSVWAVSAYPADVQVHPGMPVRPGSMYGVSKCFGEAVAAYFAHVEGLSSIAIRIGAYHDEAARSWRERTLTAGTLSAYLSARDMNHLLVRCIEAPDVPFAIVHGISDNRFKRLELSVTRELLGYAPQDDAFTLFTVGLPE